MQFAPMNTKVLQYLYYAALIISVLPLVLFKYTITVDGPAHIYNVNLILNLLSGNEPIAQYIQFNTKFQPNYLTQLVLLPLQYVFPAYLAEKLLLILLALGVPVSFRAFLKTMCNEVSACMGALLIIPLSWGFFINMGFYNFIASIIMLLIVLRFWNKHQRVLTVKRMAWLSFLLILVLLAHPVSIAVAIFLITTGGKPIKQTVLRFAVAAIPSVTLLLFFIVRNNDLTEFSFYPFSYKFEWLINGWIVVSHPANSTTEFAIGIVFNLLLLFGVILAIRNAQKWKWLLLSMVFLVAFLVAPFGLSSGGFIPERALFFFFVFSIVFTVKSLNNKPIIGGLAICSLLLIGITSGIRINSFATTNQHAYEFEQAAEFINENSTVLQLNYSHHPAHTHISSVLGYKKSMVLFENYEAKVGHFPLIFNPKNNPNGTAHRVINGTPCANVSNYEALTTGKVDYITTWHLSQQQDSCTQAVVQLLHSEFEPIYFSPDSSLILYKRIQ